MVVYWEFSGTDFNVTTDDYTVPSLRFKAHDQEYIIDLAGSMDMVNDKTLLTGRVKVEEIEMLSPENKIMSNEDLEKLLTFADVSSITLNLFEDEFIPDYDSSIIELVVNNSRIILRDTKKEQL